MQPAALVSFVTRIASIPHLAAGHICSANSAFAFFNLKQNTPPNATLFHSGAALEFGSKNLKS